MIFVRSLALRIYTDRISNHKQSLVLKREDLLVYTFGQASFAAVFSFGVVVFWNVPLVKQQAFVAELKAVMKSPVMPEVTASFSLDIGKQDNVSYGHLELQEITLPVIVALSFAFAQAVVLQRMDSTVDQQLYQLNRILRPIEKTGRIQFRRKHILKTLGQVLRDRTHSFYEYGFQQTPPEAWADARTEKLYVDLITELEIKARMGIVNEKWDTVSDTMQFVLGLTTEQKGIRLEMVLLLVAITADLVLTFWQVVSK